MTKEVDKSRETDPVTIHTKMSLHKRVYLRSSIFNYASYPPGSIEWIWPQLVQEAKESQQVPRHEQEIEHLKRGLELATHLPGWQEIADTNPEGVVVEQALRFFSEFEANLLEKIGDNHTSARLSAMVRTLVSKQLESQANDPRMKRLRRLYRARCVTVSRGRQLISDLADGVRPPVDAQPHSTVAELQHRTRSLLQADLDRIQKAASSVLRRYGAVNDQLDQWEKRVVNREEEKKIREKFWNFTSGKDVPTEWTEEEIKAFLSLKLTIKKGNSPPLTQSAKKGRTSVSKIDSYVESKIGGIKNGRTLEFWLDLREAPPGEVLLACALIIQIKTGWNFISVLELRPSLMRVKEFPHHLQSIKPRTKDETPLVFVERGDEDVQLALHTLVRRYDRLTANGFVDPSVWASSRSVRQGRGDPLVGWGTELASFCRKHHLPMFSLEMVRGQVLAVAAVSSGDLSKAQSIGGHVSTGTTFNYVNKLLVRRLNAANSLEFERRFDATVNYMINPESVQNEQQLLSYPVGDGSSCRDPRNPPLHSERLGSG